MLWVPIRIALARRFWWVPQLMFLWRTDENYPSVIIKYTPYLFHCQHQIKLHEKTCLWSCVTSLLSYRVFDLWIWQLKVSSKLGSKCQKHWSDCKESQADLHLCCWHDINRFYTAAAHMSHVTRKPVFGVFDQVWLRGCAGWSAPLLLA